MRSDLATFAQIWEMERKNKSFNKSKKEGSKSGFNKGDNKKSEFKKPFAKRISKKPIKSDKPGMRLNQFIAHSGISSRREADKLIKAGLVQVNGKIIVEMGFRVMPTDTVKFNNETIASETKRYLLLNKPKDYLTSTDDPKKKNVYELISKACKERLYPVGRLDRITSGLLLFTNDNELSKKLTHPKQRVKKIYHITLDKNLKVVDINKIKKGVSLDGHIVEIETISYVKNSPKKEVGIEIHTGKNSVLKKLFTHLGYKIIKMDLVYFGGLTKKDISRGRHRFLSDKEVSMLKMI